MTLTYVNGQQSECIPPGNRGLQYGDGIFETIRYESDLPLLGDYHLRRFKLGAARLNISFPKDFDFQLQSALDDRKSRLGKKSKQGFESSFICKMILTRGAGGRGYRPEGCRGSTLIISFSDLPSFPDQYLLEGVDLIVCEHRLSENPVLSGLKHLNRLDQVLASAELGSHPEGLMCDQSGFVVEGTKSNVLFFRSGQVLTPRLTRCGVSGCLRQFLIDNAKTGELDVDFIETDIPVDTLNTMDGAAVINSVFGLWPVKNIDGQHYQSTPESLSISTFIHEKFGI